MSLHLVRAPSAPEDAKPADSLDELYDTYCADVRRWALRLAGPHGDLDDLVHDVFVIALRRGFVARGEGSVRTWLFRITNHVVRGQRRRQRIRRLLFRRHEEVLATSRAVPRTAQEQLEMREDHMRLYQALDRLPDCYRTPLILFEIEGMPGDEIAELLGVTEGTLWVRLHRGRAKLLAHLRQEKQP